jgi:hypothetical protein
MLLSRMWSPLAAGLLSLCFALTPSAAFGQWNERTELTFSDAVMVPGATLQPGTYVFRLMEPGSAGDILEIRREDGALVTTTMTVPTKRMDAKGDTVLKINPTEEGTPPALAAWFYPGSVYGHQFVYPEEQARKIAQRTKTIVLSTDVPGTDLEKGKIRVFDASGASKAWTPDADAMASWQKWSRDRRSTANIASETAQGERARAMAPAVDANFQGARVELDELEENPSAYHGKTVSVDGEVEDVYGPRIFTIDERNWGDLDGELLVLMPSPMAALVREDDRITVTGKVKPFVEADFEEEWGWLGIEDDAEVELSQRPVLVASRVVGGNDNVALVINAQSGPGPVGTTGNTGAADTRGTTGTSGTLTDLASIGNADEMMVGRSVDLDNIAVHGTARDRGFFAKAGNHVVFVLPMANAGATQGQNLSIEGVIMEMPRHMRDTLDAPSGTFNDDIYIYATKVSR